MKISPLVFLDIAGILILILLTILLLGTPLHLPLGLSLCIISVFMLIRIVLAGLVRVAESALTDGLKLCWVLLILLLPVLGSLSCLIVVDKRRY